jgi:hypothetical protein
VPKYLGPYDVIQDGEGGKVYHVGDPVNLPAERIRQMRDNEHYRFEDDPPEAISPVHAVIEGSTVIMPPNEFGQSEMPAGDADKDSDKKARKPD